MSDFRPDIWRLQAQFNTQGLVDALNGDDAGIRKRAAAALRALGAVDAIPALEQALEKEHDPESRSNILAALASLQQESERRAVQSGENQQHPLVTEADRLIADVRKGSEQEIIAAAQALGEQGVKEAVVPLVIRFNDPETPIKVRLAVAEALLRLESAPVEVALLGALRSDEWRVRRNAAAILGQLRAEWAIEPLSRALADEREIIRKTALAALKNIGTQEARTSAKAAIESFKQAQEAQAAEDASDAALAAEVPEAVAARPAKKSTAELEQPKSFTDEEDVVVLEQPKRDAPPVDETQKIIWPRRQRKREKPINPTLAPTRPLDPKTLQRAQRQMDEASGTLPEDEDD